jgi:MarR family transcriptional regulator for hemolysin
MARPTRTPIGLKLARVAKSVARAFDAALVQAGGSQPAWLVLLSLKTRSVDNQRELAEAIGIQGATLTHHLNAMEADGLLTRSRDPENRRAHLIELTESGEQLFQRLRGAAAAFDKRLRASFTDEDIRALEGLLDRLQFNVMSEESVNSE